MIVCRKYNIPIFDALENLVISARRYDFDAYKMRERVLNVRTAEL